MTGPPDDPPSQLSLTAFHATAGVSWHGFLDVYAPLRSELYRYCRHLTRTPWDAEDLAQDSMARAFVTLGRLHEPPPNPRAWLFRVASNLWLDQVRKTRVAERSRDAEAEPLASTTPEPQAQREAAGTLIARLSPQERAAVVLKDVFDLAIEEIAEALATSPNAVKAALHRGRGKLVAPEDDTPRVPVPGVIDAFCEAFNAQDVGRLTSLLLSGATIEVVGATAEYHSGDGKSKILHGMLYGSRRLAEADKRGGIEPRFMQGALPFPPRCEVRVHRGEPLVLLWYAHTDGEAVRGINRVEVEDGLIARLQNYFFTPDFIAEICGELGVPFRSNGYRWFLPTAKS